MYMEIELDRYDYTFYLDNKTYSHFRNKSSQKNTVVST